MTRQIVNIGAAPNDGTGDTARAAFDKVNQNFKQLYGGHDLDVLDFGADPTGTADSTTALQNAIDAVSTDTGIQGRILLGRGTFKFSGTLILRKNVQIVGRGLRFVSVLKPVGDFGGNPCISVDGDACTGGWAYFASLSELLINCSQCTAPVVLNFHKAYSCEVDRIYIHDFANGTTGIRAEDCNQLVLKQPRVYGHGQSSGTCILIGNKTSATLFAPDVEAAFIGIVQSGYSQVDVFGGYAERNILCWDNQGTGHLSIVGGRRAR